MRLQSRLQRFSSPVRRELPDRADVMLARIRQDRTGNRRKPPYGAEEEKPCSL